MPEQTLPVLVGALGSVSITAVGALAYVVRQHKRSYALRPDVTV